MSDSVPAVRPRPNKDVLDALRALLTGPDCRGLIGEVWQADDEALEWRGSRNRYDGSTDTEWSEAAEGRLTDLLVEFVGYARDARLTLATAPPAVEADARPVLRVAA